MLHWATQSQLGKWGSAVRVPAMLALVLVLILGAGCTRKFFRNWADSQVDHILKDKDVCPNIKIQNYHVYPNPIARFADPTNPDRPPMPPDDPCTKMLSPNPQHPGKAGIALIENSGYLELLAGWDCQNRAERALEEDQAKSDKEKKKEGTSEEQQAPAQQPELLPAPKAQSPAKAATDTTAKKDETTPHAYLLKLDQAAELGLINSREFQNRREDLYLTALPVTLQRFSFAPQFFFTEEAIRERTGRLSPDGYHNRWRFESATGFTQLFSTGALLVLQFANQTVVELTGKFPRHTVSVSTLNLDLVQPFLRGGGWAITLEALTQAERNLVYEIRSYARFRKEFYVYIAGGGDFTPDARFFGAFVLRTTPGLVEGRANLLRPLILPGTGQIDLNTAPAPLSQGFLPTLLVAGQLSNERQNVRNLELILRDFKNLQEGDRVSPLQVGQVNLTLLSGQSTVLQRQQDLRDALDRFKLQLGVPPPVCLELEDSPIRPLVRHMQKYEKILLDVKEATDQVTRAEKLPPAELRNLVRKIYTNDPLVQGTKFQEGIRKRLNEWEGLDLKQYAVRMKQIQEASEELNRKKSELEKEEKTLPPAEEARLQELEKAGDTGRLEGALRTYEARLWERPRDDGKPKSVKEQLEEKAKGFRDVYNAFLLILIEPRNERLEPLRTSWPSLAPARLGEMDLVTVDLDTALDTAVHTALDYRLDLMNVRAQLVDAWRQVAVFANSLLGVFNVAYHMDVRTPPGEAKPFNFQASRARNQLILNGELPLVRLVERNNYRATLIAFQRQRRALMAAEDTIANNVRAEIRALRVLAQNYKIQQEFMHLAYQQLENAMEVINAPPDPRQLGSSSDGNQAALTNQLLQAQQRLISGQNGLYNFWINYQIARLQLFLDMELMHIDDRGVWIDECNPPEQSATSPAGSTSNPERGPAPEALPPPRLYFGTPAGLDQ